VSSSFAHLHVHTEFSMLDGAARVKDVVSAAVTDGQPAIGITDHGNMYGVLDFYKECRAQGINPIIGTEAYMAANSRHERPVRRGRIDDTGGSSEGNEKLYYHLTLLAESGTGYRNLPGGLLPQAPGRLGVAGAPPGGRDRHHRLPGQRGAPGPSPW
jgi:DNA polymerase-3 subunit alpha